MATQTLTMNFVKANNASMIYEPSPSEEYTVNVLCDKLTARLAQIGTLLNPNLTYAWIKESFDSTRDPVHFARIFYHPNWLNTTGKMPTRLTVACALLMAIDEDSLTNTATFIQLGKTVGLTAHKTAWNKALDITVNSGACVRDYHAGQTWYGAHKFTVAK